MAEFIRKSCLSDSQRKEIVGYYKHKLKKVEIMHAAHVVHHYADSKILFHLSECFF